MIFHGGDYNPDVAYVLLQEDIRHMQQTEVTMATVGLFSWAQIQPKPGVWDFT